MLRAVNPATGEVVREVPCDTPAEVEARLNAAVTAFGEWRRASFGARAAVLRAVAGALRAESERLAGLITEEVGKVISETRGEVEKSASCAEHYAEHAEAYLAPVTLASDATRSWVQHVPLGTVLGILPWNSPAWLAFRVCAPALMAGNVVLLKNDPHVPGCAKALAEAFARGGAPAGLLQSLYLQTEGVEPVLRDARVRAVSFTGSTRGGAAVAAVAASEVKPAVLELGGSDPCLVLGDADLEAAASAVCLSRTIATGQSCIAVKRLIVEEDVHDRFVDLLRERLAALRVGDPTDESMQMGPLARADLRDALHRQVRESVQAGARLALGGEVPDGPGFFYPPTLLTEVPRECPAFREETFGPVAAVTRARDLEHAVALANDTEYGLAASVWTSEERAPELAERLSRDLEAGQVVVNGLVKTDARLPSGGIKRSGYGRELGPHGIQEFVNRQQVWLGPKRG